MAQRTGGHAADARQPVAELDLPGAAARIIVNMRANGFSEQDAVERNIDCVLEEAGEAVGAYRRYSGQAVGAYRRYSGQARRPGTLAEVAGKLADVVLSTYILAHVTGHDLDVLIDEHVPQPPAASPQVQARVLYRAAAALSADYDDDPPLPLDTLCDTLPWPVIHARRMATMLSIDLDDVITRTLAVIYARGWRTKET